MQDVRIETRELKGRRLWLVHMGKRAVSFHEELAARTFAAQLHMRLGWLREQAQAENFASRPPELSSSPPGFPLARE
ncbi:hypothetical protein A9179_10780 [Pseudomonas alcaligenes]|uniref:Transposase n=1 Tax=Aquipseudomonas alcaligenes TaxID=43263 RepID=A0ABR7RZJ9_AQUAC|nr:hypothetical protein [Pseudomonas alcaligenes]